MSELLYNREILRLAAAIPHSGRLAGADASVEKRSPICGSRVTADVTLGPDGRVAELGMLVRACALGQASAALFGDHAIGRSADELTAARDALAVWLAAEGDAPDWPGIHVLAPAIPHSARHASIRLAFEAGAEAATLAHAAKAAAA